MKTKIFFDHIPKTAGTSVTAVLQDMIGESGALPDYFNIHFQVIRAAGNRRLMSGHFTFMPGERLHREWYYATLLRDPIDRFLSNYWFYRALGKQHALDTNLAAHPDPQVQAAANLDLEQYLSHEDTLIQRSYTNVQAAHFSRRLVAYPNALSEDHLFESATMSLEDFDMVGVFEDTQGFVDAIADDLGFEKVKVPRLNVTFGGKKAADTPAHLLERLREANRVDVRLCEWARERFATLKGAASAHQAERVARGEAVPATTRTLETSGLDPLLSFGTHEAMIQVVRCEGERSGTAEIVSGELLRMTIACNSVTALDNVTLGISIRDNHGVLIYGTNSRLMGLEIPVNGPGAFTQRFVLQANLAPGTYFVTVALHKGNRHHEGCYHWWDDASTFTVVPHETRRFEGMVDLGLRPTAEAV